MSATIIDVGPHLFALGIAWTLCALLRMPHRLARQRASAQRPGASESGDGEPAGAAELAEASTRQVIDATCRIVAGRYGVSVERLLSDTREQPTATARQVAMRRRASSLACPPRRSARSSNATTAPSCTHSA